MSLHFSRETRNEKPKKKQINFPSLCFKPHNCFLYGNIEVKLNLIELKKTQFLNAIIILRSFQKVFRNLHFQFSRTFKSFPPFCPTITLQQEAEYVEQEENASSIQIGEESFVIHDRELVSCNIADYV